MTLYGHWVALGHPPDQYWGQTPRLLHSVFRRCDELRQADIKILGWAAWTNGWLSQVDLKRYPPLEKVTGGEKSERKAQTPDEMLAAVRAIKKAIAGAGESKA